MVKRYSFVEYIDGGCEMDEKEDGAYVRHEDYAYRENDNKNLAMMNQGLVERNAALEAECARLRAVLEDIEKKGHGDFHGRGYTLANIADRALNKPEPTTNNG
jgi:hypothetical protein